MSNIGIERLDIKKMEDEINDFIRKNSVQGYNLVDLKINW